MKANTTPGMPRHGRKVRIGTVVQSGMNKSMVVLTEQLGRHAQYKKFVKRRKRFLVHDENNACGVGDRVRIMETRPLSKNKHWRLLEIIEKAK